MKNWFFALLSVISFNTLGASVVDISAADLNQADTQDWLIIDVRSAEEYAQGHVPGAINIAHSAIAENLHQILGFKDKPVVVYCRSGFRAAKAAKVLTSNQFTQVKHLDGDMLGWEKAGYAIEK